VSRIVRVDKQDITLPLEAFYRALDVMIDLANAPYPYDIDRDPLRFGVALLPFHIYRQMEELSHARNSGS
jgi:hypothetical protein